MASLQGVAARFVSMCGDFGQHFWAHGCDLRRHAEHYLQGLLSTEARKSVERIQGGIAGCSYQNLQQFISDSPWSHEAVLAQVGAEAEGLLGGHPDTALYVDETSFVKKGDRSVGVQRQYCGRLGKKENCQVGVFAVLGCGARVALTDVRLFLPESWAQDDERCARAKVPVAQRVHRTKPVLALAMVQAARARGSSHQWVGGDEVYGQNLEFCAALEDLGETFLMDVSRHLTVWDRDPAPVAPVAADDRRGHRRPTRGDAQARSVQVAHLTAEHFAAESRWVPLRDSSKGPLRARLWVYPVWLWDQQSPAARARLLVVREDADGTFKYSLTNAPATTSWARLGFMQGQRYWIEHAFQEAKSDLGLAQYEVRGWRGWHHHMALCCLAHLFTLRERLRHAHGVPILSAADVVELLTHYLRGPRPTEAQVFACLARRHERRRQAILSHTQKTRQRQRQRKKETAHGGSKK